MRSINFLDIIQALKHDLRGTLSPDFAPIDLVCSVHAGTIVNISALSHLCVLHMMAPSPGTHFLTPRRYTCRRTCTHVHTHIITWICNCLLLACQLSPSGAGVAFYSFSDLQHLTQAMAFSRSFMNVC